jgi:hypothetical protein
VSLANVVGQKTSVDRTGERGTDERRDPDEPDLLQRPAADEERWAETSRRVHRRVRHRDVANKLPRL